MGVLQLFIEAFIVGLSGALAPGPLLTYTIKTSYQKGFWVGPKVILGHALAETALITLLLLGFAKYLNNDTVKISLCLVGGLILALIGYDLIWKERKQSNNQYSEEAAVSEVKQPKLTTMGPFFTGVFLSTINPYWMLWWAIIGLAYIERALRYGFFGVAVFFTGHILSDFIWYTLVSGSITFGSRLLSSRFYNKLLLICGLFMLFLAVSFIYDGLRHLAVWTKVIDLFNEVKMI
ncbi:MAG TPA: LysE family transporter [Bacillota bacterium]|jgi:threonine/homoserine/homoserine lactone efflux protein|nr:LysE family transporter [Bacillota bacterium]HOL08795.1 LysE family transporter [Bacillota bacterium]HPO96885.1 LysE family transporter [Bacillota bacterium]